MYQYGNITLGVGGLQTLPIALPYFVIFPFESGDCKGINNLSHRQLHILSNKGDMVCTDLTKTGSYPII